VDKRASSTTQKTERNETTRQYRKLVRRDYGKQKNTSGDKLFEK
jgi:hypothetical protein